MVGAILVSHENIADSLIRALERITGESDHLVPISSKGISPGQLESRIAGAIEAMRDLDGVILFSDLHGGSCSLVCSRVQRTFPDIAVITGVNLPLLIDYVFQRRRPLPDITGRLVEKGRAGIKLYQWEGREEER